MALRNILTQEDPALYKISRPVTKFDQRLHTLLPQVGVLRRVVLVVETNVPEGEEEILLELINPEIISAEGEQCGSEGCLSVPEQFGLVKRPSKVTVRAQDRNGNWFEREGEGLTARCFCHEIDHLNGILFTSLAERMLTEEEIQSGDY